jgi:uncharacterized membrane protein YgcG
MTKKILTYIFLSISVFSLTIPCFAVTEKNRSDQENYGVNKWNVTSSNLDNILATPSVDVSEKIYDFENVLTETEVEKLKQKVNDFVNKTNMDMAIVITSFSYSYDEQNENYAADFYDYNDFGINFENYSGVLLLRNTYESDPYFDIYAFGNSQLYFSKNRLSITLDKIYDDLHDKNYYNGFSQFIDDMATYYSKGIPSDMKDYKINSNGYLYQEDHYSIPWTTLLGISFVVTFIIMLILIMKNKMVRKAKDASTYLNKESINITNKSDIFINTHTSKHTVSHDSGGSSSGGGSFHSSSGSSGGGHSSGGGRHG